MQQIEQSIASSAADGNRPVIGLQNASKTFGGTHALRDVSFDLRGGEVLALLGENGAGKSTCVKLLAGVHWPSLGTITIDDQPVSFNSPLEAQAAGVAVMHQHPGLFPELSIAENVYMGHMPKLKSGGIDTARMQTEATRILASIGLTIDTKKTLGGLRTSEQQLVEIARALSLNAKVLIMDEPTAALSQREVTRLFAVVEELKKRNVAIMFVGHRMDEIFRISDRIAILRDGALVGLESAKDLPRERAIQLMVGRELSSLYPPANATRGKLVLETKGLSRNGEFEAINLEVYAGEILGIGGLVGSGRTEIARVLFGIEPPESGEILMDGASVSFATPLDAMKAGIAYVSEDRLGQSLVMDFPIVENAGLTILDKATVGGFSSRSKMIENVEAHLKRLKLKFRSYTQPVKTLSGGNQQKVVLSKWLATNPRVLILDEPTQGIDVESKAEVHAMIADLASQGMAIILISSEMPELIGMCDRIVVLREGNKTGEFKRSEATQEKVLRAATDSEATPSHLKLVQATDVAPLESKTPTINSRWSSIFARREMGLVAAMLAVVIPVAFVNPRIFSEANITSVSMDAALLVIVVLAQTLVLVTRNIDLSVASIIGLAAYGSALVMEGHPDIGIVAGLATAIAIGTACGFFNGAIITFGRVPAIVVTLGTLTVFRGLNNLWADGKQISADKVPQAWLDMTGVRIIGIPLVVIIALAILFIASLLLSRTAVGRQLFAIGSNPDGAALIGIPANKRILMAFTVAGTLAGLTGALWASRYATVDARVASGYELTVIASAVVGGVAIRGGAGTVLGFAFGALTLLVIRNGLTLVRVDPLWLQGVYGLVILLAISIDTFVARRTAHQRSSAKAANKRAS